MPLTESDKVVLTKYPIAPSKCVVCLRSSNGELNFIDFQMSLDIYGSVNICTDCMTSVATGLLGFVDPKHIDSLTQQIANLVEMNRKLKEENDLCNSTLDSLLKLRPNLNDSSVPTDEESDSGSKSNDFDLELDLDI